MTVTVIERIVGIIIYWIVRFHAICPFCRILPADNSTGIIINGISEHFKMFVFYYASEWNFSVRIVDHCISLIVGHIYSLLLKSHCPIFKSAEPIVEELVYFPSKDYFIGYFFPIILGLKEIYAKTNFRTFQKTVYQTIVSSKWNALKTVVEIIVVKCQPDRQTADYKRRKFGTFTPPLLFRVALYQRLIYIFSDKQQCLVFEVLRFRKTCIGQTVFSLFSLLVKYPFSLLWSFYSPHLMKGIHIEGQIEELTLIIGNRTIGIPVKFNN